LIGWEGGQPLSLKNGSNLSVGFSGFRGVTDLEIMVRALAVAEKPENLNFVNNKV
jgi:glc operon protein GlcG